MQGAYIVTLFIMSQFQISYNVYNKQTLNYVLYIDTFRSRHLYVVSHDTLHLSSLSLCNCNFRFKTSFPVPFPVPRPRPHFLNLKQTARAIGMYRIVIGMSGILGSGIVIPTVFSYKTVMKNNFSNLEVFCFSFYFFRYRRIH